ncbi:MAG: lipoprotein NlpI [Vibrio metschnikovii]|uniref:lipoprotein NlpI n=1 Tax=Vibrio metschnikovii TaxID=28172 RepID=UPI001C2F65F1|nr:lipoprotein NlpI [Vibrio metschnikovii]MDM7484313.1 lipoprotein NlpI [Vibrio metschnikovii]
MKWFQSALVSVMILLLAGCASKGGSQATHWVYPPMAIPLQSTIQQEVQIARLSQLLQRTDLNDELRAKMFFERGNGYDNLGLRDLARLDFTQSLALNPAQPDIFNLLGVYYTEAGEFDAAYEAFDSTLELDPSNEYALRNRAIALYYGDRPELALQDIQAHYQQDPSDPFRALWLYIIQSDVNPQQAKNDLLNRYQDHDEQWGWVLVGVMLDEIPQDQVFKALLSTTRDNTLLAQQLTEAYFYLGKRYQMEDNFAQAISLYKLAIAFNVYEYVEHRYAFIELGRMYHDLREAHLAKARVAQ